MERAALGLFKHIFQYKKNFFESSNALEMAANLAKKEATSALCNQQTVLTSAHNSSVWPQLFL